MAKEAHFTATQTSDGVVFNVTPASMPASYGCMMFFLYLMAGIGGLIAIGGLLGGEGGALIGGLFVGGIPAAGIVWIMKMNARWERAPVEMLVNREGITIGARTYRAEDIRELIVKLPFDSGGAEMTQVHTGVASTAGAVTGMEIRNRSYALLARLKTSSENEVLAFGLTYHAACSLLNDVRAALAGTY